MTDIRDTQSFKTKKWVLFAICLIYIFLAMIILLNADYIADYLYKEYEFADTEDAKDAKDPNDDKNKIKVGIRFVALLVIIIEFFGLIGAYKENRCLTLTYAIMMSISAVLKIILFLSTFKNFFSLLISVGITTLAFMFYRDLKQVGTQLGEYPMVILQTTQPMPQTVIPMYATTVIGYQNPQQQQQAPNYSIIPPPYLASAPQNDYPTK